MLFTEGPLVLAGLDWHTYCQLLDAFGHRPGYRLTYDRGMLEIMPPGAARNCDGRFLGQMVYILADELNLPLSAGGSTTLRRKSRRKGVEADECFWITSASRMTGKRRLDLRRDPPPDLAIEVDVTHSSLDRLEIYAALGVGEVWRLQRNALTFFVLRDDNQYQPLERSRLFPFISPRHLLRFLRKAHRAGDKMPVLRELRVWVRRKVTS